MNPRNTVPFRYVNEITRIRQLLCEADSLRQEAGDMLSELFDHEGMRVARGEAISESGKEPLWSSVQPLIWKTGHVHVSQQVESLSEP